MKLTYRLQSLVMIFILVLVFSCNKQEETLAPSNEVSEDALNQISRLGFSNKDVIKTDEGFIVEGDIFLSEDQLYAAPDYKFLRIAEVEQYHTFNLVSVGSSVRTITVRVSTSLPSSYVTATDEAIRRYNAENLRIRFSRVTSGGNIVISRAPFWASYLASAGFPSNGNPYNQILVNSSYLGSNPGTNYLATILAHEIGHCIGFRHTDWMSRQYSCGGSAVNEGQQNTGVGAVLIPGTPSGPDPNSWMLACIGSGQNRPFNTNDKVALNYLY